MSERKTTFLDTLRNDVPLFRSYKQSEMKFRMKEKKPAKSEVEKNELTQFALSEYEIMNEERMRQIVQSYSYRHIMPIFTGGVISTTLFNNKIPHTLGRAYVVKNRKNIENFQSDFLPYLNTMKDFDFQEIKNLHYKNTDGPQKGNYGIVDFIIEHTTKSHIKYLLLKIENHPQYDTPQVISRCFDVSQKLQRRGIYVTRVEDESLDEIKGFMFCMEKAVEADKRILEIFKIDRNSINSDDIYFAIFRKSSTFGK